MKQQIEISVVSPVYKAESIVSKLVEEIETYLKPLFNSYEIILVEDGSPDNSWHEILKVCNRNNKVKGVKLSRNFGQHYAITAGLSLSLGKTIIVMDCDLQDRPDQFGKLYQKYNEGYDIVFASRSSRQDSYIKRTMSRLFYGLFSYLTNTKQDASIANFGVYSRKAIDSILSMGDCIRYFPTMSQWVGFKKCVVEIEHGARDIGESSYTWKRLFELAMDNILAFSDKPLRLTVKFGFLMSICSGLVGLFYLFKYLIVDFVISGYTSLIISLWFLSGLIIFFLGMLGAYLGKIFEKVKDRPVYIIDEIVNGI